MDPLLNLILKKQNPTMFTQTIEELETELLRVTNIVYKNIANNLTFSDIILDRTKEIGYPLAPEFLKCCLEIIIEKDPNQNPLYLYDLDDIQGFVLIENDLIKINPQYVENYEIWIEENIAFQEAQFTPTGSDNNSSTDNTNTNDNNAINNFEWNYKKILVIAFFGLIVMKEIYDYFDRKTKANAKEVNNNNKQLDNEKSEDSENLKSIYEESWDVLLIEILIKILVPYSIYMLYKYRYYIYYKYFKL